MTQLERNGPRGGRWALGACLALALGCSRDLSLPVSVPPRLAGLFLVGRESTPAPDGGLPVLGRQLLAVAGEGFPSSAGLVQVQVGGVAAEVLSAESRRLVVRVPALDATGAADLTVTTAGGFATVAGGVSYLGRGQPEGFSVTPLPTTTPLTLVAPVEGLSSGGSPAVFPDLAVAAGPSDSALLVAATLGVALTSIPLGMLPDALAARWVPDGGEGTLQVLGLDRDGRLGEGALSFDASGAITGSLPPRVSQTAAVTAPGSCELPALLFTRGGGRLAVTWRASAGSGRAWRLGELARDPAGGWSLAGAPLQLAAPLSGWAARSATSLVLAGGASLETATAGPGGWTEAPLTAGPASALATTLLSGGCASGGAPTAYGPLALATVGPLAGPPLAEALAVSFQLGGLWWVGRLDLASGALVRASTGGAASAVALLPSPAYPLAAPAGWSLVSSALGAVTRHEDGPAGVVAGCPVTAAPSAALPLASQAQPLGALLPVAGGTRLLAVDGAGELGSILPASMTSPGPVPRLAAYAGLGTVPATVQGVGTVPMAYAEHAFVPGATAAVDTASALALIPFGATRPLAALGGPAYAHGAAWLDDGAALQGLALAADPPPGAAGTRAQLVRFGRDACTPARVRALLGAPLAGGPALLAQGPARAGALGPAGPALWGPEPAPVYGSTATGLASVAGDARTLACVLGADGGAAWAGCATPAFEVGAAPLDATLAAGDGTVAARRLDLAGCAPCAAPFQCVAGACPPGDLACQRVFCPVAPELLVGRSGGAVTRVALPGAPAGVAADPGGGFLVTVPCGTSGGTACFAGSTLCERGAISGLGMGALLHVAGDGGGIRCLTLGRNLAGPLAVTPNGSEAWLVGAGPDGQLHLTRVELARSAATGAVLPGGGFPVVGRQVLGKAAAIPRGFPASGVVFSPDGEAGLISVPGELKLLAFE